jgi:hypothetical protein
MNIQE